MSPTQTEDGFVWYAANENPFGVELLDVRPLTRSLESMTEDEAVALSFKEQRANDGRGFLEELFVEPVVCDCRLKFSLPIPTTDGPLFKATVMEDKWDIYFHEGYLLFARSWTGSLIYKCTTVRGLDSLAIAEIEMDEEHEDLATQHVFFLMLSHLENTDYPCTVSPFVDKEPMGIAMEVFSLFGRRGGFATYEDNLSLKINTDFRS